MSGIPFWAWVVAILWGVTFWAGAAWWIFGQ